jgi:large conductance mechanosensitive channel
MFKEFRDFAIRGNVVDLAVGIIIGAAFTAIVTSLVNDVIMPPVGFLAGGIDFSDLGFQIAPERVNAAGETIPAVVIAYGKFINAVISFLIVAWVVFLLVKGMNSIYKNAPETPAGPTTSEKLLEEIRDLLAKR